MYKYWIKRAGSSVSPQGLKKKVKLMRTFLFPACILTNLANINENKSNNEHRISCTDRCLSKLQNVFDHFLGLALKGLTQLKQTEILNFFNF